MSTFLEHLVQRARSNFKAEGGGRGVATFVAFAGLMLLPPWLVYLAPGVWRQHESQAEARRGLLWSDIGRIALWPFVAWRR